MDDGVGGLNSHALAHPDVTGRLVPRVERLGFTSWWSGERLAVPSLRTPEAILDPKTPSMSRRAVRELLGDRCLPAAHPRRRSPDRRRTTKRGARIGGPCSAAMALSAPASQRTSRAAWLVSNRLRTSTIDRAAGRSGDHGDADRCVRA